MKKVIIIVGLFFLMATFSHLMAQCPMCKIAAESNLENGGTSGKGLNSGILYMLLMPYLLVGIIGFIWYKNRKKDSIEKFEYGMNQN
jgi:hypothetical protein